MSLAAFLAGHTLIASNPVFRVSSVRGVVALNHLVLVPSVLADLAWTRSVDELEKNGDDIFGVHYLRHTR